MSIDLGSFFLLSHLLIGHSKATSVEPESVNSVLLDDQSEEQRKHDFLYHFCRFLPIRKFGYFFQVTNTLLHHMLDSIRQNRTLL